MKKFRKNNYHQEFQNKDIYDRIEESKDKFYFMLHGLNGFN
ncbi:MAG TPA: hypothetical protein PK466_14955 [Thermotogota bacterium]|nr:hypothetical protein [Thermotogota bacterium]